MFQGFVQTPHVKITSPESADIVSVINKDFGYMSKYIH